MSEIEMDTPIESKREIISSLILFVDGFILRECCCYTNLILLCLVRNLHSTFDHDAVEQQFQEESQQKNLIVTALPVRFASILAKM
jgi:hypothetical protein